MRGDSSKVIIIEPGIVKGIDGKEYYNPSRIIAGHPEDVAAYHKEQDELLYLMCECGEEFQSTHNDGNRCPACEDRQLARATS